MRKLLLSIKPKYVKQILEGTKLVEYRKKIHTDNDVMWALIYESHPTMRVVGEFQIMGILEGTPEVLWEKTEFVGGICKQDYFKYFSGHGKAFAYQIGELKVYKTPLKLEDLGVRRAPQSFQYVEV